jgi:hypothetical protein
MSIHTSRSSDQLAGSPRNGDSIEDGFTPKSAKSLIIGGFEDAVVKLDLTSPQLKEAIHGR